MNPRLARLLTRLYPRSWRERYGAEFEAFLATGHGDLRTSANIAWSALRERILPTQVLTMDQNSPSVRFQSWCARAPWATFGLAPLFLLAGAYLVACSILWLGWKAFLPGADTPFGGGRMYGFANLYFQFGKLYYFSAPILVGWGIELIAFRQRAKAVWPVIGLVLIAWMGAAARIQAGRTAVPGGLGHIRMDFALGPSVQSLHDGLFHALMILLLTVLPYLHWRFKKARPLPSVLER
jgi:hypothetical protein